MMSRSVMKFLDDLGFLLVAVLCCLLLLPLIVVVGLVRWFEKDSTADL